MGMKWSDEQLKAINNCGHNILVSAGAGSGKTAVLTERIYQLVKKGYPITRFLVLTFTKAAAMEMKSRVRNKILEDSNLSKLAPDIENAHIETFDSFCLFLVKKYAAVLNVSPSIVVIDQTILGIQENKIIENIFKRWYEKNNPLFNEMVMRFSIKNDERLKELVKNILRLANLQLDKEKFFNDFERSYLTEEFIKECIQNEYKSNMKSLEYLRNCCDDFDDAKTAELYSEVLDYALEAKDFNNERDLFSNKDNLNFAKRKTPKDERKDFIKKSFKAISETDYGNSDSIVSTFNEYKKYITLLVDIAKEADEDITNFQREHNAYSFSDIAKMAIKLVRNESACKEVSDLFDFIMVDEYQDTSDVQEEVITRLSKDNLYMVGDVKQSIYRFRNANCNIFNDKFNRYKKGIGGEEIDLNKSFRSREEIVNAINDIFGQLMRKDNNIIDYSDGHNFEFGNKTYSSQIQEGVNYKVDIAAYDLDKETGENAFDKEMGIITSDIIRKINSGYKVADKDDGFRPCSFKDFAIIIDRKTKFDLIKKYFSEKNIPINAIQDESLKESYITYVTKNLIRLFYCVKNDVYDVTFKHAYCSIARSFLVNMKDRDLFVTLSKNGYPGLELSVRVKKVIDKYGNSSLFEILNGLYEEFGIYDKIPSIGDCSSSAHKCDTFLQFASNMDTLGYDLEDMYNFFDELTKSDLDMAFGDNSNPEDAVTLINIHKSKGLEYPVIYFPFLGTKFNRDDQKSSFMVDQKFGVVLPMQGRNVYASLLNHQIKENDTSEDFEEKLRLFYVALTRAREKIVMIVDNKVLSKKCFDVRKATNFGSFLASIDYDKYLANYKITDEKLNVQNDEIQDSDISLKTIKVEGEEIVRKRASKEKSAEVNESLLDFGTKIHYALELLNYETKDLSYIQDGRIRKYVNNVINSFVFKDIKNSKILHEYRFFDEVTGVNGIIDCLIVKDDEIDIIDFKLKNISDSHYDEQLRIYEDYVKKISSKLIKKYLISAITGEVREVE